MRTTLAIRAVPGAKQTACEGLMADGETLRVRLAAPPADGKANAELVRWFAETLGLPRGAVRITAGTASRHKRIEIDGLAKADVYARLLPDGGPRSSASR